MKRLLTFLQLLVLLMAITFTQGSSEAYLDTSKNLLAKNQPFEYNHSAFSREKDYGKEFDTLGITLHPGSDFTPDDRSTPSSLNHCKSLVYRTLKSLPENHTSYLKNLTLYFSDEGRRGLGGGSTIILRCQNVTDAELVGVLIHEIGHIVDTGKIQGSPFFGKSNFMDGGNPVYNNDLSKDFYELSFTDEKTLRKDASPLDFVSGYAKSDPFEDFAEAYVFYVLHGNEFRMLTKTNKVLKQKYNFLKTRVFEGKEYFNGHSQLDIFSREYDTTVLDYSMKDFFAI